MFQMSSSSFYLACVGLTGLRSDVLTCLRGCNANVSSAAMTFRCIRAVHTVTGQSGMWTVVYSHLCRALKHKSITIQQQWAQESQNFTLEAFAKTVVWYSPLSSRLWPLPLPPPPPPPPSPFVVGSLGLQLTHPTIYFLELDTSWAKD